MRILYASNLLRFQKPCCLQPFIQRAEVGRRKSAVAPATGPEPGTILPEVQVGEREEKDVFPGGPLASFSPHVRKNDV